MWFSYRTDVFSMKCTNTKVSKSCYGYILMEKSSGGYVSVLTDMLRGFTIAVPKAKQTTNIIAKSVIHHGSANKKLNRSSYSKSCTEALNLHYG